MSTPSKTPPPTLDELREQINERISARLEVHLDTPGVSVGGYEYDDGDQPRRPPAAKENSW